MGQDLDGNPHRKVFEGSDLCFPGIGVRVELQPLILVFFPSSLLVHYNFPAGDNDPRRASVVLFVHESLVRMVAAGGGLPNDFPEAIRADQIKRELEKLATEALYPKGPSFHDRKQGKQV